MILNQSKGQDFSKVNDVLSYGCWCQIRNQEAQGIVPGHGTPVDELDAACKRWHQCRACTAIDFSIENSCDPNTYIDYEVGFDPVTYRIDCQFNPYDCQVSSLESFEMTLKITSYSDNELSM